MDLIHLQNYSRQPLMRYLFWVPSLLDIESSYNNPLLKCHSHLSHSSNNPLMCLYAKTTSLPSVAPSLYCLSRDEGSCTLLVDIDPTQIKSSNILIFFNFKRTNFNKPYPCLLMFFSHSILCGCEFPRYIQQNEPI